MSAKQILVCLLILNTGQNYASIVPPVGCPIVCPTGNATFCGITAGELCVTGNLQVGGNVTICGQVNVTRVYGYFFDQEFSVTLDPVNPTKIPFAAAGVGGVINVGHPNATDIIIQIPGVYLITYRIEPDVALPINSDFEIQKNGNLVPGSIFTLAAELSNIEISAISIIAAHAGDIITVVTTALLADTILSGKSTLVIEKIG